MFDKIKAYRVFAKMHREFETSQGVPSSDRTSAIRAIVDAINTGGYRNLSDAINSLFDPVAAKQHLEYFNGWAYSAMMARVDGIQEIPIHVKLKTRKGTKGEELADAPEDHWLKQLQSTPNSVPHITFGDIIGSVDLWQSLAGCAYIYAPVDPATGKPGAFYTVPATSIAERNDTSLGKHWVIVANGVESKPIPYSEVIRLPLLGADRDFTRNMLNGKSRIEACIATLKISRYTQQYLANHFQNHALPQIVLENAGTGEEMYDADWQKFVKTWLERHQGVDAAVPMGAGPRGYVFKEFDTFRNQKQLVEISNAVLAEVLAVFKVPKGIMTGEYDVSAPAASFNALWYTFKAGALAPPLTKICAVLTRWAQQYDPDIVVVPEPIAWLDPEEVRRDELHRLQTGQASIDDLRKENDRPLIGGDVGKALFLGPTYELLDSKVNPPKPEPPPTVPAIGAPTEEVPAEPVMVGEEGLVRLLNGIATNGVKK